MKGSPGDAAIYINSNGERYRAVIQSETMGENASLVYWDGENPSVSSLKMAVNIPHKSNTPTERNVYEHKPEKDWAENIL